MQDPLPAGTLVAEPNLTPAELALAARNHAMPLEAMAHTITPLGLHYLLTHFDIPLVTASAWHLAIGGNVLEPLSLTLDELRSRPATTLAVTLECAGNGRALLSPRPMSQPWLSEAVGTAEWTGTALGPLLKEAGMREDTIDIIFTGLDRGVQGGVDQYYERSLPRETAMLDSVLIAYAINGVPLPPQHGFPARLIVPGWYGMAHVKWLRSVTVSNRSFNGYQQSVAYQFRRDHADSGTPVTRILPRALMVPPGIPDFMSRTRYLPPSECLLEGRAWSGWAPITKVEVSVDGGTSWVEAALETGPSPFAWQRWTHIWHAHRTGAYELCVRATDGAGNAQPASPRWNTEGVQNNAYQRLPVVVRADAERAQPPADI